MVGREEVLRAAKTALAACRADQAEVVVMVNDAYLTRFAENCIHQNVGESNATVNVRAVLGKKIGVSSTNDLSDKALRRTAERAVAIARLQREDPAFVSLPGPEPIPNLPKEITTVREYEPEERAERVAKVIAAAKKAGVRAAGSLSTGGLGLAVVNSLGIEGYTSTTSINFTTVVMSETSSGYADWGGRDLSELDVEALGQVAVKKCLDSRAPRAIEPGEYEVILEAPAVADILSTLGYLGLSALAVQEGRSFMNGRFGEKVAGDNIDLWDDGLDPAGMPIPFDFEGVPKRRVDFITGGVAKGVVWDSHTANREPGKHSTGHALPAPNVYGPLPINLFLGAGRASAEDLLASTRRGILVTRFHYTNPIHPTKTIFTGMTRDGTFLVEDGRVTAAVKNLRFTEAITRALANVDLIGRERRFQSGFFGGAVVPALKVKAFNFTGVTEF